MICPCKDCERKGCGSYHDQCEDYQNFVRENQRLKDARRVKSDVDYLGKPKRRW